MRKRVIVAVIGALSILAIGSIWLIAANRQPEDDQSKAPTDEEKIISVANNDPAASQHQLTASTVQIDKKDNNWYLATITYRSAVSGMYSAYPTILLRGSEGDFSIVAGFDDSTSDENLAAQGIPKVIRDAIVRPGKETIEDISP
ncbi:MAG: hypothetical protein ACM3KF_01775 [Acidobacteriota bacterium]